MNAWLTIPRLVLFELEAACKRVGVNMRKTYFYRRCDPVNCQDGAEADALRLQEKLSRQFLSIKRRSVRWKQVQLMLREGMHNSVAPGYAHVERLSAFEVCLAIVERSNKGMSSCFMKVMIFLSMCLSSIPLVLWRLRSENG